MLNGEIGRIHFAMGNSLEDSGGLNRVVKGFANAQANLGFTVNVIDKIGLRGYHSTPIYPLEVPEAEIDFRKFRGEVQHFHFAYTFEIMRYIHKLKIRDGGMRIFHFHGPWSGEGIASGDGLLRSRLKKIIENDAYSQFDCFWTASAAFASILSSDYGVPDKKILSLGFGVDTKRFRRSYEQNQSQKVKYQIGTVRRLEKRMGIEYLIEALKYLPDSVLSIAGVGSYSEELKSLVLNLNLNDRVNFLGYLPENDLPSFYSNLDVCVIPSTSFEGFSATALESFACGTPVLASDIGGLRESVGMLSRELLFQPQSSMAIVKAIQRLRNSKKSSAEVYRKYAEQFEWIPKTVELENWIFKNSL